ncbi:hypothetical protein ACWD5A_36905, partial [Streptomyces sp. NPDC002491]
MAKHWGDFQYEIYLNGTTGAVPRLPTDLTRLEELVERRLGPGPVGYVAGDRAGRPVEIDLVLEVPPVRGHA